MHPAVDDLAKASKRAESSLRLARQLLDGGYPSPSLVWSVRAVEIFLKEFVLPSAFIGQKTNIRWERAVRKASKKFGTLKWDNAFKFMQDEFGPLDSLTTHDARDVLVVWNAEIVPRRHNIVHGKEEASADEAAHVMNWAEEIIKKLKLRLIVSGKHTFSDVFGQMYRDLFEQYHGHPPPEDD